MRLEGFGVDDAEFGPSVRRFAALDRMDDFDVP